MACDLANPCSPSSISPSAWDGVKDLCKRVGMTEAKVQLVIEDIRDQRAAFKRSSAAMESRMHSNLLKWYANRVENDDTRFSNSKEFAMIVFSIKVTSADIETYFLEPKIHKEYVSCKTSR